jgi:hypothetical protein
MLKLILTKLISLLLLIIAPIGQIVVSALKISGRITLHLSVITFLAFIAGIILSIAGMQIVTIDIQSTQKVHCGILPFAFLFTGIFIAFIASPIIGVISYFILWIKQRSKTAAAGSSLN